jgi:hypothetical protein
LLLSSYYSTLNIGNIGKASPCVQPGNNIHGQQPVYLKLGKRLDTVRNLIDEGRIS